MIGVIPFFFRNWQISNRSKSREVERSSFQSANWRSRREKLDFYDFPFWIIHYRLAIEGGDSNEKTIREGADGEDKGGGGGEDYTAGGVEAADEESQVCVDMLSSNADFTHGGPPVASCWGLSEMIVIQPAGEEILGNDTRARMVVGAVNIALQNTGCPVACLVQVKLQRRTFPIEHLPTTYLTR